MICLDTTFIIDFLNEEKEALKKAEEIKDKIVITTTINEFETMLGCYLKDLPQEKVNKTVSFFNCIKILNFDTNSALKSAEIVYSLKKSNEIVDKNDCLTAGIALSNGCQTMITRNVKHFEKIKELKVETY